MVMNSKEQMLGSNLLINLPALHLQVEVDQAAEYCDGKSRKRHLAFGLAGLMLMGLGVRWALPRNSQAGSKSRSPHHFPVVAFVTGAMPAVKPRGLLPGTRSTPLGFRPATHSTPIGFRPAMRVAPKMTAPTPDIETFPAIPGLVLLRNFVTKTEQKAVTDEVRNLALAVDAAASGSRLLPMRSPAHNLDSLEEFVRVKMSLQGDCTFQDDASAPSSKNANISCEHFSKYGDGHQLTYFRGNANIPRLGLGRDWLGRLGSLPWVAQELAEQRDQRGKEAGAPVKWRMTLNHYLPHEADSPSQTVERVGFPWHRDLDANGAASMILALGSAGKLEFGRASEPAQSDGLLASHEQQSVEPLAEVTVHPGSLLVLTGAARWQLIHRVVPEGGAEVPERLSLVFGCW